MNPQKSDPVSLYFVAAPFLIFGTFALARMITAPLEGRVLLSSTALGLLIGFGLLRRWRTARWSALALCVITICVMPISVIAVLAFDSMTTGPDYFIRIAFDSKPLAIAAGMAYFIIAAWQIHILNRSDVRALFLRRESEPALT